MSACILDNASKVEQEALAHTLALRKLNKPTFESFKECVDCQEIVEIKGGRK